MSKKLKVKCNIALTIARRDVSWLIDHARKVYRKNPAFEYGDGSKEGPIQPEIQIVNVEDAIDELIFAAVDSGSEGFYEVAEVIISPPEPYTPPTPALTPSSLISRWASPTVILPEQTAS